MLTSVVERQIPDREGFEFGVSGADAALEFVIDLREAGGHLPGIRTGTGDHDDRAVGFDVGVGAVSAAADNGFDLGRISFDRAMGIDFDAAAGEFVHEGPHGGLVLVAGDHDRLDVEPPVDHFDREFFKAGVVVAAAPGHAAGTVEQNVHRPEGLDRLLLRLFDLGIFPDVHHQRQNFAARGADPLRRLFQGRLIDVAQYDVCARCRQFLPGKQSHAGGTSSDECGSSCEFHIAISFALPFAPPPLAAVCFLPWK